jgi:fructoselysine-6-P-deglycase FrlB-like protein
LGEGRLTRNELPMTGNAKTETSADDTTCTSSIAFRLLEMQQRLEAWDQLYNQEVVMLQRELAQLKATFARQQQAQAQAGKPRRGRTPRKARETTPSDP